MFKSLLPNYRFSIAIRERRYFFKSLTFDFLPFLPISTRFSPKKSLELVRIHIMLVSIIFINSYVLHL